MLDVRDLGFSAGKRKILSEISFMAKPGSICAVIGPNGAGKSTLLKLIAGIIRPETGSVSVNGEKLCRMTPKERAKRIAYLPQNTQAAPCTVHDAVLLGRKPFMGWYPSSEDYIITADALKYSGLDKMAFLCVTKLSGGEFQKVLTARAMVQGSPVLLMDEPVNHLDIKNRIEVMEMTAQLTAEKGLVSVIVMHELNLALRYAETFLIIENGKIRSFCNRDEADSGLLSSVYQTPVEITRLNGKITAVY